MLHKSMIDNYVCIQTNNYITSGLLDGCLLKNVKSRARV